MQAGLSPVVVIPIWIPFKSSSKIELLNVASRIVANQKSLSEDTAVFAYIEVEALYLESSGRDRGGRRDRGGGGNRGSISRIGGKGSMDSMGVDGYNFGQTGGYVRRITTLTSIIRDSYGPRECQPRIEYEKFVLQPGAEGPYAHVLEGEIGIVWPDTEEQPVESAFEFGFRARSGSALEQRSMTAEIGTLILDRVIAVHPLSFTVQTHVAARKRLKAVVDSIATCSASASWQNGAAVIQGTLQLSLQLEYEDGTLGRWSESVSYQVPEPLVPNYEHNLYVFIDHCHVDPQPVIAVTGDHGEYQLGIAVTVKGIIAETCPEAIALHAPIDKKTMPQFKTMRISGAADTVISRQKRKLTGTVVLPGTPTGHIVSKIECGNPEQTGGSLLQEITAICDLFYVDGEGEKCLEVQLTDVILTPVGNYPATAFFCGTVSADEEPIITSDLKTPGKFDLAVPFSYQVNMRELKTIDAYVRASGSVEVDSVVDAVVEEIIAQKQTSFLVEYPTQNQNMSAVNRTRSGKSPLSDPIPEIPELTYECVPETDSCLIRGVVNLVSYVTGQDGKEVYQSVNAGFCERLLIPGCRPDLKQRCSLRATVLKPANAAAATTGTPSVLIEADLTLYRYCRCEILSGTSITTTRAALGAASLTSAARGAAPGTQDAHSRRLAQGWQLTDPHLALEHRLFWQSKPPLGTGVEPVRIETKAEDLRWRIADDLLIIDGMVGRVLYFADRNQRLYCSGARIPFRMAALLPEQPEDIWRIRIQRIDGMALPKTKKGVQLCLEEEYRIYLEIIRKN